MHTPDADVPDGPCHWTFAPQVAYSANGYPIGIAIGDFSGDGVPDILAVNGSNHEGTSSDNVALLINHGDGTFARRATFTAGFMPFDMAVGDFSGDGKLDLAIIYEFQADAASHELSVFLNHGDGTFAPAASYPINGGAYAITAGDFNGDGRLDLAITDALVHLSVLTNRGNGTFGSPVTSSQALSGQVTTADFNRDGALDIATPGYSGVDVLINQRNGTFAAPVEYPYSSSCMAGGTIAASDIDGDGYPELIRTCYQYGAFAAMRVNKGDGTLGAEVTYATGQWPVGLVVGDFTGRGRNDLAVANSWAYANTVSVLPNVGGTFGPQVTYAATTPNYIAAGDLNRDGHADLVTAGGSTLSVLLSTCE